MKLSSLKLTGLCNLFSVLLFIRIQLKGLFLQIALSLMLVAAPGDQRDPKRVVDGVCDGGDDDDDDDAYLSTP